MSTTRRLRTTTHTRIGNGPGVLKPHSACLVVIYGAGLGKCLPIDEQPVLVGRGRNADLQLSDPSVSREHFHVWREGEAHWIKDLGSTNHTLVNDEPLGAEPRELHDEDHITVGENILKFVGDASVEAPYHSEVYQLTTHDELTGLHNRRYFLELLDTELARTQRHGHALSVCLIDIDLFKRINDSFGHAEGDRTLQVIAGIISDHARIEDVAARIGGEEFAVLFPETPLDGAVRICERLRQAVKQHAFEFDGQPETVTISTGVAALLDDDTRASILRRADEAMYEAKHGGRDKVCARGAPSQPAPAP